MAYNRKKLWIGSVAALVLVLACALPMPPRSTPSPISSSPLLSPVPETEGDDAAPPILEDTRLTPLLLILAGGLLFLVTGLGVYFLIRGLPQRGQSDPAAVEQPPEPPVKGDLLPEGTLLDDGRFLVLGVRHPSGDEEGALSGVPLYEVKATVPLHLCQVCYALSDEPDDQFCSRCGATLTNDANSHPVLLAQEVQNPQAFEVISYILQQHFDHPAIVLPVAAFTETSFGPPHFFIVAPDVHAVQLSTTDPAPSLDDLLVWGIDLAQGLDLLHQKQLYLQALGPDDIIVTSGAAHWLCLDNVDKIDEVNGTTPEQRDALFSRNVHGLADLLYGLLTRIRPVTDEALWSPVDQLLTRVRTSVAILRAENFTVALQQAREALIQQMPVHISPGAFTDTGRIREINEDSLLAMDLSETFQSVGATVGVFAVADGVGGQDAGDIASQLTVEAIGRYSDELRRLASLEQLPEVETWITGAARAANEAVFREREMASSNMGCTLVLTLVVGRRVTILNVGDSRAYRLNERGLTQITTDHSLVQRLVEIGQLTPEQARHHPQKSVIYRVIGDSMKLDYDLFEQDFQPGEAFLLCSDGLTDMVEDAEIWLAWRDAASPQAACEALVALANEAGGHDNVTVVIVAFEAG